MNLILETDRLILRPLAAEDLDIAIALWTDPDVARYVADRAATKEEVIAEMPTVLRRCVEGAIGVW